MSYNVNLHHVVFRTKNSAYTIPEYSKRLMLSYINADSDRLKCKILWINSHLNHVHILVDLDAEMDIAQYVKTIKANSSRFFRCHEDFPYFIGWAKKYGNFTVSRWDKDKIINYIKNQEEHHRYKTFAEELADLFGEEAFKDKWWRHDWLDESKPSDDNTNVVPPALP